MSNASSARTKRWAAATAAALILGTAGRLLADGPCMMNYQAYLRENGQWVSSNGMNVVFCLYNTAEGGAPLYREQDSVTVEEGLYATHIGDNPQSGLAYTNLAEVLRATGSNTWLGVTLAGGSELVPRERVLAAPYVLAPPPSSGFSVSNSYAFAAGTTQRMDRLTVNTLVVSGAARFEQGIGYLAPLGDLSMGSFTNAP